MNSVTEPPLSADSRVRCVIARTRGLTHGPVTRLMSPSDLGQQLKPFVFLDLFDVDFHDPRGRFPIHPHSGLATITVITEGDLRFDDPADGTGYIGFGGFEWMRAGNGVWHGNELSGGTSPRAKGFQLWIALRYELELAAVDSQYVQASEVPTTGPAHVILGSYGGVRSPARCPSGVTYLLVRLRAGECWTFKPPGQPSTPASEVMPAPSSLQSVGWLAVASGALVGNTAAVAGEMLIFDRSGQSISLQAGPDAEAVFVIGSAVPHPHSLHLGKYSVHTSPDALAVGEVNIERLRRRLVTAGDRRTAEGSIPVFRG